MKKILVILGPTAIGKTALGLKLAKQLSFKGRPSPEDYHPMDEASGWNGELISCDSRQVYKGLDIGTGKEPSQKRKVKRQKYFWEIDGIKIWMYDVADPKKQYTVAKYVKDVGKIVNEIIKRGSLPIIVGGTGLYLKALLYGLPNLSTPVNPKLRVELKNLSKKELQRKLKGHSLYRWRSLNHSDKNNPRRIVRAIELEVMKSKVKNIKQEGLLKKFNILKIGLTAPKDIINQKIDERVALRIDQGLIEEIKRLNIEGVSLKRMEELGLEYGVGADYLSGKLTRKEFEEKLKIKIHQFAKRQLTWFKKEENINWFDATDSTLVSKVEKIVGDWYNN